VWSDAQISGKGKKSIGNLYGTKYDKERYKSPETTLSGIVSSINRFKK